MMGQIAPSANLQITVNRVECLTDLPDGCAALQKCLDRLEKWAGVFVIKFNKSCTWRNNRKTHSRLVAGLLESSFAEKDLGFFRSAGCIMSLRPRRPVVSKAALGKALPAG